MTLSAWWHIYMRAPLRVPRQWFCSHRVYLDTDDLKRWTDDLVTGRCHKCEKVLTAPYGLALNCQFDRKQQSDAKVDALPTVPYTVASTKTTGAENG